MEEKFKKYLPIGTVVLLKGGTKKVMITGFCAFEKDKKDVIYDYNGCIYPEGYISSEYVCLFNHKQIDKIYYLGYCNEDGKQWKQKLNDYASKLENGDKEAKLELMD